MTTNTTQLTMLAVVNLQPIDGGSMRLLVYPAGADLTGVVAHPECDMADDCEFGMKD